MGNFDHDTNPDHDWDDSWDTAWNEFDWEQYLRSEDDDLAKYQALYNKLIRSQNRLDEVALFMGWQQGAHFEAEDDMEDEAEPSAMDPTPYTLHKHPLFISSKALHNWLAEKWTQHVSLCSEQVSTVKAMELQAAYSESDYYGLLAVTALDLDDYALAIAYFKRGMVAINRALALLAEFESTSMEPLRLYAKKARIRLFDIREIWLRVSSDCRATIARGSDEDG